MAEKPPMPDAPPPRVIVCVECGQRETLRWNEETNADLSRRGACFLCNFWLEKIEQVDDPKWVRPPIRDRRDPRRAHYSAEPANLTAPSHALGHGGQWFRVEWHDGRVVETNNLWSQGAIPERFWDRLPVNATVQATHQGDTNG